MYEADSLPFEISCCIHKSLIGKSGGNLSAGRLSGTFSAHTVSKSIVSGRIASEALSVADSTIGFDFDTYSGHCKVCSSPTDAHREEDCLLEALRAGTNEAYETLISVYEQPVYNLVFRLMNDPADACDVVQEVFLKVFRNIKSFRGNSSLKTWIYRISFNEAYNHRRWFSRHKKQEIGLECEEEGNLNYQDVLPDPGRSAFEITADHETHAMIEEALAQVNPAFRAAVVLRDMEDLSYDEIAEILQVSLGTVKSRILRGREALRKVLASRLNPDLNVRWTPQQAQVK
jgi:RNA polymerase sigma-70 factor, ECF subfamily